MKKIFYSATLFLASFCVAVAQSTESLTKFQTAPYNLTFGGSGTPSFTVPSGATLTIASGANITNNGTATGFGSLPIAIPETSSFSPVAATSYLVDCTSAAVTATLPASPTQGQTIQFTDATNGSWSINRLTVNPNGAKINSVSGNALFGTPGTVSLTYQNSTVGWLLYYLPPFSSSFSTYSDLEPTLTVSGHGSNANNVLAIQNLDAAGTSAITFRSSNGTETGAIGYDNTSGGAPFLGNNFIEDGAQTPVPNNGITVTGNGTTTITLTGSPQNIFNGQYLTGAAGITTGTKIVSGANAIGSSGTPGTSTCVVSNTVSTGTYTVNFSPPPNDFHIITTGSHQGLALGFVNSFVIHGDNMGYDLLTSLNNGTGVGYVAMGGAPGNGGNSNLGVVQIFGENTNGSGNCAVSIQQESTGTFNMGYPISSGLFVMGCDGASLAIRQNPTRTLTGGTERVLFSMTTGTETLDTGNLVFGTAGQGIVGGATSTLPTAGNVGSVLTSVVTSASPVSLTTATTANVCSIAEPAGHYLVSFQANVTSTTATMILGSPMLAGISTTSATLPTTDSQGAFPLALTLGSSLNSIPVAEQEVTLSSSGTIYGVEQVTFTAGTEAGFGKLTAIQLP